MKFYNEAAHVVNIMGTRNVYEFWWGNPSENSRVEYWGRKGWV